MVHAHWKREEVDLSYLNLPDINAMLLMGDFRGLERHNPVWTLLPPPERCLELLFVTAEGVTIQQQIVNCLQVRCRVGTMSKAEAMQPASLSSVCVCVCVYVTVCVKGGRGVRVYYVVWMWAGGS